MCHPPSMYPIVCEVVMSPQTYPITTSTPNASYQGRFDFHTFQ